MTLVMKRLELGEDDVLALAIDCERSVPSLPDARVYGARGDPAVLREELAVSLDDPPAGADPIRGQGIPARLGVRLLRLPARHRGHARGPRPRALCGVRSLALAGWRETQPVPRPRRRMHSGA